MSIQEVKETFRSWVIATMSFWKLVRNYMDVIDHMRDYPTLHLDMNLKEGDSIFTVVIHFTVTVASSIISMIHTLR